MPHAISLFHIHTQTDTSQSYWFLSGMKTFSSGVSVPFHSRFLLSPHHSSFPSPCLSNISLDYLHMIPPFLFCLCTIPIAPTHSCLCMIPLSCFFSIPFCPLFHSSVLRERNGKARKQRERERQRGIQE